MENIEHAQLSLFKRGIASKNEIDIAVVIKILKREALPLDIRQRHVTFVTKSPQRSFLP